MEGVESSNLETLIFISVKTFGDKTEQKIFRLKCSFHSSAKLRGIYNSVILTNFTGLQKKNLPEINSSDRPCNRLTKNKRYKHQNQLHP